MTVQPYEVDYQTGCARCGGDGHEHMRYEPLTYPIELADCVATHWARCPANGQPILLVFNRIEEEATP